MVTLKLKIDSTKFKQSTKVLQQKMEARVFKAIVDSVMKLQGDMKNSISTRSGGRKYKRKNGFHIASKAGDAPNTDTGFLVNSILQNVSRAALEGKVFVDPNKTNQGLNVINYAKWLEYGTSKMAKRPFFRPAIGKNKELIRNWIREAFQEVIKK